MNKVIKSFAITFILLAIVGTTLFYGFGIDLTGMWQVLIALILFGVPTLVYFENKKNEN